jgi:hypothetical protein
VADVKGDLAVKNTLDVTDNAKFRKGLDSPYFEVIDEKNPAVLGGGAAAGAFVARDLTKVIVNDFATNVNLSAQTGDGADFTLPAGEYYIEASAPAFNVGNHVARLADVTNLPSATAPTVVLGTSEFSLKVDDPGEESTQTRSEVVGRFTLPAAATLELQHQTHHTDLLCGFGAGGAFYTVDNVYSTVRIWAVREDT